MAVYEPFVRLLNDLGAPGAALLVAAIGALLLIGHQLVRLRKQVEGLRKDIGQSNRDAIVDAWQRLLEMRAKGLSEEEASLLKAQLLATIQQEASSQDEPTQSRNQRARRRNKDAEVPTIPESLVRFGFFAVWGIGWGAGMAFFLGGATLLLGTFARDAHTLLSTLAYSLGALLAALAYVGLGLVLPLAALANSLSGLLQFCALMGHRIGFPSTASRFARVALKLQAIMSRFGVE